MLILQNPSYVETITPQAFLHYSPAVLVIPYSSTVAINIPQCNQ